MKYYQDFRKIGCVIVAYNPDIELLNKVIESIISQVYNIVIVDNSEKEISFDNFSLEYIYLGSNKGIAYAQNVGLKYLINNNYSHVIFLDQDTIVESSLINNLYLLSIEIQKNDKRFGGIAPIAINLKTQKKYRVSKLKNNSIKGVIEVNELMNSASLIQLNYFKDIGLMDEELFIDGVDYEWCWRAKDKININFYISLENSVQHQLGEGDRFLLYRNVAIPTPLRTYYQYRNFLILCQRKYVPLKWKLVNGLKYILKICYYPTIKDDGKLYISNILSGIKDGLKYKKK